MYSRLVFALMVTPWAAGCLAPSEAEVEVVVLVEHAGLRAAWSADVDVTVTNFGPGPVEVQGDARPPTYDVFDEGRERVGPRHPLCILVAAAPITLEAGQGHTYEQTWDGETLGAGDYTLIPGTYRLRGKVWVRGFGLVRSRPVEVHVTPTDG